MRISYDFIISNPPYIRTQDLALLPVDVQREPGRALDGGEDGLKFLRFIIENAWPLLNEHGFLVLEIDDDQSKAVRNIGHSSGFKKIEFQKDYIDIDRIVTLIKNF